MVARKIGMITAGRVITIVFTRLPVRSFCEPDVSTCL